MASNQPRSVVVERYHIGYCNARPQPFRDQREAKPVRVVIERAGDFRVYGEPGTDWDVWARTVGDKIARHAHPYGELSTEVIWQFLTCAGGYGDPFSIGELTWSDVASVLGEWHVSGLGRPKANGC